MESIPGKECRKTRAGKAWEDGAGVVETTDCGGSCSTPLGTVQLNIGFRDHGELALALLRIAVGDLPWAARGQAWIGFLFAINNRLANVLNESSAEQHRLKKPLSRCS